MVQQGLDKVLSRLMKRGLRVWIAFFLAVTTALFSFLTACVAYQLRIFAVLIILHPPWLLYSYGNG